MTDALLFIALAMISALAVRAMIAVRLMDQPDPRKLHRCPVPKGGGVGIVAAFMLGGFPAAGRIAARRDRGRGGGRAGVFRR